MIIFRNLGDDVPPGWAKRANWQVEYHPDADDKDRGFPLGLAWVLEVKPDPDFSCDVIVKFILVPDDERRKGIGTKIVMAIRERWPQAMLTGAISHAGEALVRKFNGPVVASSIFTPAAIEGMKAEGLSDADIQRIAEEHYRGMFRFIADA